MMVNQRLVNREQALPMPNPGIIPGLLLKFNKAFDRLVWAAYKPAPQLGTGLASCRAVSRVPVF
jgi:hypothetical protein